MSRGSVAADKAATTESGRHEGRMTAPPSRDRHEVVKRQRDEFGGFNWGSAFFGWLVAIGLGALLTAILSAAGAAIGLTQASESGAKSNAETIGLVGGILLLVVSMIAYYAGGYVAGRMARFDGVKQGIAVWLWGIIIAIVVAILAALAGDRFNVLSSIGGAPSIPVDGSLLTASGLIALAIAVLVPLIGAILGGKAGMSFHRKVDQVGINHQAGI